MAKRNLNENKVTPAWMPVTAQPAALLVLDPSVKTQRALRPFLEESQMRWSVIRLLRSALLQAMGSMESRPAKGWEESWSVEGALSE